MTGMTLLLSSALLLLNVCYGSVTDCSWVFEGCFPATKDILNMECNVSLHLLYDGSQRPCGRHYRKKIIMLDSTEGIKYDKYCNIRSCRVKPTWCQWGSWENAYSNDCGDSVVMKRSRTLCCHPVTSKSSSPAQCLLAKSDDQRERRLGVPCPDNSDSTRDDSDLFRDITIGCFALVSVVVIMFCCRSCKVRNRDNNRSNAPVTSPAPPPPPPPAPVSAPSAPPVIEPPAYDRPVPGRVIRAPNPPPILQVPPNMEAEPFISGSDLPPAYEEATSNEPNNSSPPKYEVAIQLVS